MTAAIAIALMIVLGAPAAWRLRVPGVAFLFGSGIVFLAMQLFSLAGVHWSLWPVLLAAALLSAASFFLVRPIGVGPIAPHAIDVLTLVYLAAYAFYASEAAPWHWDYWAIWGLKGRVFFEHGGIDWAFLQSRWNEFAHPDYPQLLPLNFALVALLGGGWEDRWLGALFVAFAASLALVARQLAARELPPLAASAIAFAVAALASSQYVGLAEVPLIAFGTAGILFARQGDFRTAAVLLGFAASTKNEGLALLVAVLLLRWRSIRSFWPALIIVAPWLLARSMAGLALDLTGGSPLARLPANLSAWPFRLMGRMLDKPWCWWAVLASLPLTLRRERFLFGVVALQFAFFAGAYAITPNELWWHIATSWDRLSRQLLVPASYAALIALAARFARGGTAVAEARPEP